MFKCILFCFFLALNVPRLYADGCARLEGILSISGCNFYEYCYEGVHVGGLGLGECRVYAWVYIVPAILILVIISVIVSYICCRRK